MTQAPNATIESTRVGLSVSAMISFNRHWANQGPIFTNSIGWCPIEVDVDGRRAIGIIR
jgi:hypothetical protein